MRGADVLVDSGVTFENGVLEEVGLSGDYKLTTPGSSQYVWEV